MMCPYATTYDFVESQLVELGHEYVYGLVDRGYEPILTERGWKWILRSERRLARNPELLDLRD